MNKILVPLGETNEEFYQSIYTGQQYIPQAPSEEYTGQQYIPQRPSEEPPPLPSQPPAWETVSSQAEVQDEADGPSWVCKKCTFDNHPLMDKCEECYTPRYEEGAQGRQIESVLQLQRANQRANKSLPNFPSTSR